MRARILIPLVLAVGLGAAVALASTPLISAVVGRWEVESAYRSLRVADTWIRQGEPVVQILERGGVLLTVVYQAPR